MTSVVEELKKLAGVDLFKEARHEEWFVGRPFYLDYDRLRLLSNDSWKHRVGGVPAGAFLLCVYDGDPDVEEALLVRVLRPTKLPTDDDVVAAMVDHYKEALPNSNGDRLDSYTRAEFQFSGLECRVIGTFYRDSNGKTRFAGDLDNFYAPNNYRVFKPATKALEYIVNFRDEGIPGGSGQQRIGAVRYSSSLRHHQEEDVNVYVSVSDFIGKRTALFGMTRTGKSNTVKKLIQATVVLSQNSDEAPIGQIIFDVNGEYANANQQDEGTAVFEQYPKDVTRYSVINKPGFKVLKLNFYREIAEGFGMLVPLLAGETGDYVKAFTSIDWESPDPTDVGATTRYDRKVAAYKACLHNAGFPDDDERVKFSSCKELMQSNIPGLHGVDPKKGLSLSDAAAWFTAVWDNYTSLQYFADYKRTHGGRDWADEDLQSIMRVLTRKREPGRGVNITGFRKLMPARDRHTSSIDKAYADEIIELLRDGKIVIIDLSQGNPEIQRIFSDRVCQRIFDDAMERFIRNEATNYIQLYFEEAHNLFPRREDKDLTVIYNRLAKEGQKLRLGLNYATQEVSSISSSILKNTQNWFVSHLNNEEELREIRKYYDFEDFTESLKRTTDKGFIRMKTDSNTFIVPVQIDRFSVNEAT